MTTQIECPRCRRHTVSIIEQGGAAVKTRCSSCGWEGPKCFGQHWDPNNQKCQGGADPTNWGGGSHVRPKCTFEPSCSTEQDRRSKGRLIPAMNMLSRPKQQVEVTGGGLQVPQQSVAVQPPQQARLAPPPQQTPAAVSPQQRQTITHRQAPAPVQAQTGGVTLSVRAAQQQQTVRYQAPQPGQQIPVQAPQMGTAMAWVPPQQAAVPMFVPQNYPQPGAQVPAYLTTPEPIEQGIVPMFFNSCMRAAFKGMFHTAANLMDHVPWGGYPAPPPAIPPGGTTGAG